MFSRIPILRPMIEIARARRIAEVLIRNGLGFLAESTGLSRLLSRRRRRAFETQARDIAASIPQRIRHTLEELGPTYIKLGQVLSTRPDILPPAYIHELSLLLDAAPPAPWPAIREIIERELRAPLDQHYARVDPDPIASASIGQVHRAERLDGTQVVIKAQRPGVEGTIEADLNLLLTQARFVEARSSFFRSYHVVDILEEFAHALRDELDYTVEGRNADRLRELVGRKVAIPRVYWDSTTRRVITMERLQGVKLSEPDTLRALGYDLGSVAHQVVETYLEQVFVHGIFHADPHPANILVCDTRIGLVDFGVVGFLTPRTKEDLGDTLFALVQQDAETIVQVIQRMGVMDTATNAEALRRDVQRLIVRYYGASLETLPVAEFLDDIMGVAFRHHVRLPADLALLARTVVVLEGVAYGLDPDFTISHLLEPFTVQLVRERLSIRRTAVEAVSMLHEIEALAHVLPRRIDLLSQRLERGDLTVGIQIRHLQEAMRKLDAIGNRVSFSVVVAAIIVGSALVLAAGADAATFRLPFTDIGLPIPQVGFVMAGLLGAWLLFSIVRSRGL